MFNESEFAQLIGDAIKDWLEDSWMTQKELAYETGIAESTISRYIHGDIMPSLKNLVNIAVALDCDFNDLIRVYDYIE